MAPYGEPMNLVAKQGDKAYAVPLGTAPEQVICKQRLK